MSTTPDVAITGENTNTEPVHENPEVTKVGEPPAGPGEEASAS